MDDVVTPRMLLQHMQGMKSDLQTQISHLASEVRNGFAETRRQFEEAREHRQALQEDLEETMRQQSKQNTRITRLQKG